jgi:hypothetical protein
MISSHRPWLYGNTALLCLDICIKSRCLITVFLIKIIKKQKKKKKEIEYPRILVASKKSTDYIRSRGFSHSCLTKF